MTAAEAIPTVRGWRDLASPPGATASLAGAGADFAQHLRDKSVATTETDPASSEFEARRAAEDLVAAALVRPILANLRSTSRAEAPFAPGLWEKQFAPMLDATWSETLVRDGGWDLVDAVARSLRGSASDSGPYDRLTEQQP